MSKQLKKKLAFYCVGSESGKDIKPKCIFACRILFILLDYTLIGFPNDDGF